MYLIEFKRNIIFASIVIVVVHECSRSIIDHKWNVRLKKQKNDFDSHFFSFTSHVDSVSDESSSFVDKSDYFSHRIGVFLFDFLRIVILFVNKCSFSLTSNDDDDDTIYYIN